MKRSTLTTSAITAGLVLLMSGCVVPPNSQQSSNDTVGPGASRRDGLATATPVQAAQSAPATGEDVLAKSQQYLIVQGPQTGLVNAADDGAYTLFSFQGPVGSIQIFDQDGKKLTHSVYGSIAGVQGVFKGVLIRRDGANSFIAGNPRAAGTPKPRFDTDARLAGVIRDLDAQAVAMPAFKRALELTASSDGQRSGDASQRTTSAPVVTPALPAPKARDDEMMVTDRGVMYRVFFAVGGRAIVRPDDGLERIEEKALNARRVEITAYTDNVGREQSNSLIARERANIIRDYLVRRGVPEANISVRWVANSGFLAENDTAGGRALNRRAEILLVSESDRRASIGRDTNR